jgi:hypothetical protein
MKLAKRAGFGGSPALQEELAWQANLASKAGPLEGKTLFYARGLEKQMLIHSNFIAKERKATFCNSI